MPARSADDVTGGGEDALCAAGCAIACGIRLEHDNAIVYRAIPGKKRRLTLQAAEVSGTKVRRKTSEKRRTRREPRVRKDFIVFIYFFSGFPKNLVLWKSARVAVSLRASDRFRRTLRHPTARSYHFHKKIKNMLNTSSSI